MHNSTIRIFLHHYKQTEGKMKVNEEVKNLLKQRRFKWKTLKNEVSTGYRIEVMEGSNLEFKEQMDKDTAFIYRRGLNKDDFKKDTLTLSIQNQKTKDAVKAAPVISISTLISSEWNSECRQAIETLKDKEDTFSHIREALLAKDIEPIFAPIKQQVSPRLIKLLQDNFRVSTRFQSVITGLPKQGS